MLLALLFLAGGPVDLADLQRMAQARDVDGLTALLAPKPTGLSPFAVLKSGGAYGVGKYGWKAIALDPPGSNRHFVVLSTQLTSEDTGELLFESKPVGLDYIPEDQALGLHIVRHSLDVRFKPAAHGVVIKDLLTVEESTAGLGFLRLGPQYRIDVIDGKQDFVQSGGIVALNLPAGRSTLNLAYHAEVNLPQFAAAVSASEATLANDYWYPMVARGPAPYDVTIHVPVAWSAVGQGELVEHKVADDEAVFKYRMDVPIVYYSLSAGPFKQFDNRIGDRRYSVWTDAMSDTERRQQTELYAPIIQFYNDTFGPFPFSGYGAMVSRTYGGGALEAYSYATYGLGWLPDEDSHEPSHTWWGGIIPNTYLHSFWNESFADYSTGLYSRNVPIGNRAERALAFVQHADPAPAWDVTPMSRSGVEYGPVADALGYGKGAFVLDALENELGVERMEATLHHWVESHAKDRGCEWEDYERAVHESTGEDFTWFFDQWLRRPGYPRLNINGATYADGAVSLPVTFEGQPFRMTAEVLLRFADGHDVVSKVVIPASPSSTLSVPAAEKPVLVSFDPYRRLVRKIDPDEAPVSIGAAWGSYRHFATGDKASPALTKSAKPISQLPKDLDGAAVIGMPGEAPIIDELARRAGFAIAGDKLTYDGTTIDLNKGAALAIVELGQGKRCLLALGRPELHPNTGDAYIAVTDYLGRFVRGKTHPKTSGHFVFRL